MNENQLIELTERYLNGELSTEEKLHFEKLCQENAAVKSRVEEHLHFTGLIKQYGERIELENRLNAIHQEIDVHTLTEELTVHPSWIVKMWRNHHSKISVAASVAIFAMLVTLYFTGYFNKNTSDYMQLKQDIRVTNDNLHKANALLNQIKNAHRITTPNKFGGTGFALTTNGYLVTAYHVVRDADSLYVQNQAGDTYHAKLVYSEPIYDIAILKVDDPAFKNLNSLPYSFKKGTSDIGENVYTYGYPGEQGVFGQGYLSSATGYQGDTSAYEVAMPVNPGNSGGPLLDEKGSIVGIISGKQTQTEGAAFAIQSSYLFKAIQNIKVDSISQKLNLNNKNAMAGLTRKQQVKKLKDYVYMVKVY